MPFSLLFYGRGSKETPMSKSATEEHLARALERIGIPADEQHERKITFHGWRHFLNTLMRPSGIADAKTRRITGHRTCPGTTDLCKLRGGIKTGGRPLKVLSALLYQTVSFGLGNQSLRFRWQHALSKTAFGADDYLMPSLVRVRVPVQQVIPFIPFDSAAC